MTMTLLRTMIIGLIAVSPCAALAADPAVVAPINKFVASFNAGDIAGAEATVTEDVAIIDEVAPFLWQGKGSFKAWLDALSASDKAKGITDQKVTIGTPIRDMADGTRAYVIVPATYNFNERGKPMKEVAQMTFALVKGADGWKIIGWTWTGPEATPAN